MPRPKLPEQHFRVTYRLTRTQIRKVEEMGGVAWLRQLISKSQKSKVGRDPVQYIKDIKQRNHTIVTSPLPTKVLAERFHLSVKRVQQIRREWRKNE